MAVDEARLARDSLVRSLAALRNHDGGWPYYRGKRSRLEPTCWAMLGTGVSAESTPLPGWLQPSGLLVEPSIGEANFGFNALAALAVGRGHGPGQALVERIVAAVIEAKGDALPPSASIRQNNSLQGWPWISGTFSWVEPTAWCMLALKKTAAESTAARARIAVAEDIMRDRECKGGGWNVGNAEVFGHALAPHVPPTAIVVMALQDRRSERVVADAARFLEANAIDEGSTTALALSAMALACVGRPSADIAGALVARGPEAEAFGNVAALGMAAYVLDGVVAGRLPEAFVVSPPVRS